MKKHGRVDANQSEIVGFLRAIPGVTVISLASLGGGVPDIMVGRNGRNYMFEIKDPEKPPSQRKLTKAQKDFHLLWRGQVSIAETFGEILNRMRDDD